MRLAVACSIVCFALFQPIDAHACSCEMTDVPVAIRASQAVFSGQVIDSSRGNGVGGGPVRVTFRVTDVWKGPVTPTVVVVTPGSSASCGYSFAKGGKYLVYAHGDRNDDLRVSLCSQTKRLEDANADLAILGKAIKRFDPPVTKKETAEAAPTKDGRCSASSGSTNGSPWSWLAVLGVGLGLAGRRSLCRR